MDEAIACLLYTSRYKEEEAQKALEKAQAVIERKTKVACKEAIERTISEKFDGLSLIHI